jgi:tripartite-type tricarboxylate transporter receptor subunit TctC
MSKLLHIKPNQQEPVMHNLASILRVGAIALAAAVLCSAPAHAQTWPQRTVKFILPLGPGSGADIGARLIADHLTKSWGQSVVVENRPGADGVVAITAFIGANDDHTLLFGPTSSFVGHPYTLDKLPYDASKLAPIARITNTMVTIAVPPALNVDTLADFFKQARAQPGKFNWATITGITDIIVAGYIKSAGLDMAKVPYRNPVQALTDVAENRIHFYIAALAIVQAQMQAGRVKVLAVTNRTRAPAVPQVPTVIEAGVPGLAFDGLVGLFGPPEMPAALRDKIATDLRAALADPAIANRLNATGQVVAPGGPAEFAASIQEQRARLDESAKTLGVKPKM